MDPRGHTKVMKLHETLTGISEKGTDINFINCGHIDFYSRLHTSRGEKLWFYNKALAKNYAV